MSMPTAESLDFPPIIPPVEEPIFVERRGQSEPEVVYLASPYSHKDPEVMEWRYRAAVEAAAHLMLQGDVVFSPIAHSHAIGKILGKQAGGPLDANTHAFWMAQDLPLLRRATRLVVLMLPGWSSSKGLQEEIQVADDSRIPVDFVTPEAMGVQPLPTRSVVAPEPIETQTFGPAGLKESNPNPKDGIGATKLPLSLVPATAMAHAALAHLDGACKYGTANWRVAGVRASIYLDAVRRHLAKWESGEECDGDSGVHHLGHAIACLNIVLDADACGKLHDDRPPSVDLSGLYARLTPEVARIKAAHAHRKPYHYTIKDTQ